MITLSLFAHFLAQDYFPYGFFLMQLLKGQITDVTPISETLR